MPTEREKMLAGELYDPLDPELVAARVRARDLCQALNATRESEEALRRRILIDLFGAGGNDVWMQPPFYCDYGSNIFLGKRVFFNFNCVVLDVCAVRDRRLHAIRTGGADLHGYASARGRASTYARIRKARHHWFRRLGRRRRRHLSRRHYRFAVSDRRRQRRHARHPGRRVRRGQSLPRHPIAVILFPFPFFPPPLAPGLGLVQNSPRPRQHGGSSRRDPRTSTQPHAVGRGDSVADTRYWRQHGDFFNPQQSAPQTAPGARSGQPDCARIRPAWRRRRHDVPGLGADP